MQNVHSTVTTTPESLPRNSTSSLLNLSVFDFISFQNLQIMLMALVFSFILLIATKMRWVHSLAPKVERIYRASLAKMSLRQGYKSVPPSVGFVATTPWVQTKSPLLFQEIDRKKSMNSVMTEDFEVNEKQPLSTTSPSKSVPKKTSDSKVYGKNSAKEKNYTLGQSGRSLSDSRTVNVSRTSESPRRSAVTPHEKQHTKPCKERDLNAEIPLETARTLSSTKTAPISLYGVHSLGLLPNSTGSTKPLHGMQKSKHTKKATVNTEEQRKRRSSPCQMPSIMSCESSNLLTSITSKEQSTMAKKKTHNRSHSTPVVAQLYSPFASGFDITLQPKMNVSGQRHRKAVDSLMASSESFSLFEKRFNSDVSNVH
jgi:hypothetical protein